MDLSKSGTYINKTKIGQGKSHPIKDGDYIGITAPSTKSSFKLVLVNLNVSDTTEERSESEVLHDFVSNVSKTEASITKNRPKEKSPVSVFTPRKTRSQSCKTQSSHSIKSRTRSSSNKRRLPENNTSPSKKKIKKELVLLLFLN